MTKMCWDGSMKSKKNHFHALAHEQGIRLNIQKHLTSDMCESVTEVYALKLHAKCCYGMQTTQAKHARGPKTQS